MKTTIFIIMGLISNIVFGGNKINLEGDPPASVYDITINTLEGGELDLSELKGKKILFVNVASKCGYTPQYKDLEKLHKQYRDQLCIIGVPCNQFGGQEPGTSEEIATFCEKNYGVTFQLTEKIDVKGSDQHPLYEWLTKKSENGSLDSKVKWNFQKYLVDEDGNLVAMFNSGTKPMSSEILGYLK